MDRHGRFHLSDAALDRLFNRVINHDWGIVGAGVMPSDERMRARLEPQDWLSTVIELDPHGYTARVRGSMIGFADVSFQSLILALATPEIRIVSLTVTEGGYFIDPKTGGFDGSRAEVLYDAKNPHAPKTVFGAIVAALRVRKSTGIAPFTLMSCDNVPANGKVTRASVLGFADAIAPDMISWIAENIAFPNSMVDCITPATGERERELVAERFGIEDPAVVVCEPSRQWVLEDVFPQGRPALEEVGVEFVSDVGAYELMKLRILNGGHAAIAYPSALLGMHYAHDAMNAPLVRAYLEKLEREEIIPTLPWVPGVDLTSYFNHAEARFSNAEIGDTIARLCLDGSNRQPKFIFPTVADRLERGLSVKGLALEVALWCRYCAGTDDAGQPLKVHDENAERLRENALRAQSDPYAFLSMSDIFGPISVNEDFAPEFSAALKSLWRNGTAETLETYVNGRAA